MLVRSSMFFQDSTHTYIIYKLEGMWRLLQQDKPDDFVLATGEMHSVREFVEKSFAVLNIAIRSAVFSILSAFLGPLIEASFKDGKAKEKKR
jgi:hypothetical protein